MHSSRLTPQRRPQTLAELEVAVIKAEAERDRYRQSMSCARDDDELRRANGLSRIADQRLALLCRSRAVLLVGLRADGAEAEAATP